MKTTKAQDDVVVIDTLNQILTREHYNPLENAQYAWDPMFEGCVAFRGTDKGTGEIREFLILPDGIEEVEFSSWPPVVRSNAL